MILIDTNIISEMMKSSPSLKIIQWLDAQDSTQLYISTITIAKISYGIEALPKGNRQLLLEDAFIKTIDEAFKYRILSFDENAAYHYGKIMNNGKDLGRPLSILDGQIASIAKVHDLSLATRNIKDFQHCNIELINPFDPSN